VHAFLEGTTCRDLVRELGRSPPVDSNKLFDIATSFASGEEAEGAIFDGKKGKRTDDAPAEGSKSKELHRKAKRKKGKKPRREAREQGRDDNDAEALAVDPARRGPSPRGPGVFDDMLKKPCPYHKTPVNHTLEQCDLLKRFYGRAAAKDAEAKKDGGDGDAGGFPAVENVFLIFGWPTVDMSSCQRKRGGMRFSPRRRRLLPSSIGRRMPSPSATRITRTASPTRARTRWWSTRSSGTRGSRRS
jgi:hypothetical protein